MTIEVKLFAIRCRINQTTQMSGIFHIIIITDVLYIIQKNFNLVIHLYQIQSIAISKDL